MNLLRAYKAMSFVSMFAFLVLMLMALTEGSMEAATLLLFVSLACILATIHSHTIKEIAE